MWGDTHAKCLKAKTSHVSSTVVKLLSHAQAARQAFASTIYYAEFFFFLSLYIIVSSFGLRTDDEIVLYFFWGLSQPGGKIPPQSSLLGT